jgi:site-specific DNA-methyltransferase (adenine-specific)
MACAIEDAGFEIRDTVMWNFGSGFPKSRQIFRSDILPIIESQLREQGVDGEIVWR